MNASDEISANVTEMQRAKLLSQVRSHFMNLAGFSALIYAAGYFVVHSYIATFSHLFTYSVKPLQYLAAGINLLLHISAIVIILIVIPALAVATIFGLFFFLSFLGYSKSIWVRKVWEGFRLRVAPLWKRVGPVLQILWRTYTQFSWFSLFVFVVGVGIGYGQTTYGYSPQWLGGGMPATVVLLFKEPQPTATSVWGFPIDASLAHRSEPVQLLLELSDGFLVRHQRTNVPVIVKSDALQGIIEVPSASPIPSPNLVTTLTATTTP